MKLTYAVVFEKAPGNWCAYAPDVLGCISTGDTWEDMLEVIREALTGHIELMLEDGDPLPEPTMSVDEAIAYHLAVMTDDDIMESDLESYDFPPTVATRFELVEIEVCVPEPAPAVLEAVQAS
jgi:predicted RNase H-like HicB family nuclease